MVTYHPQIYINQVVSHLEI